MLLKEVMGYIGCSRKTVMKYKKKGMLSATKNRQGYLVFNERQVRDIVSMYDENVDVNGVTRHDKKNIPVPPPPNKEVKQFCEENEDNPEILNDFGKQEIMRATKRLDDMGILEITDKGVILRYAIASQMQQKYLYELGLSEDNTIYLKMYEVFTKQVMSYEKSLGFTPESMSKMNPPTKHEIDEMEGLING